MKLMGALQRKRSGYGTKSGWRVLSTKNIFEVFCKSKKVHTCSSAMVSQWE
jgi:hypothetical protein